MELDFSSLLNGLAGVAAMVVCLTLRPAIMAVKKLAERHEDRLDSLDTRVTRVETKTEKL